MKPSKNSIVILSITSVISFFAFTQTQYFALQVPRALLEIEALKPFMNNARVLRVLTEDLMPESSLKEGETGVDRLQRFCTLTSVRLPSLKDHELKQEKFKSILYTYTAPCLMTGIGYKQNLPESIRRLEFKSYQIPKKMRDAQDQILFGAYLQNKNYLKAEALMISNPDMVVSEGLYSHLGSAYMNKERGLVRNYKRAADYYHKELQLNPDNAFAALNLAFIQVTRNVRVVGAPKLGELLERSYSKDDKALHAFKTVMYLNGLNGVEKSTQKVREQEEKLKSAKVRTTFYITDFYNEKGWGIEALTVPFMIRFWMDDLIKPSEKHLLDFAKKPNEFSQKFIAELDRLKVHYPQLAEFKDWFKVELNKLQRGEE